MKDKYMTHEDSKKYAEKYPNGKIKVADVLDVVGVVISAPIILVMSIPIAALSLLGIWVNYKIESGEWY